MRILLLLLLFLLTLIHGFLPQDRRVLGRPNILIPRSLWRQETCWASQYKGSTETPPTGPTLRSSIRNTSARRRRQQGVLMHSRLLVKVQLWSFIGRGESLYFYFTGPRNCIGMRFALLEAKVALLAVCRRFATIHCLFSPVNFFSPGLLSKLVPRQRSPWGRTLTAR